MSFVRLCPLKPLENCLGSHIMPCSRGMSSQPPPAEKASEIINNLPSSPNLVTKTGTAILGTGLLATVISQELYVMNEETVLAVGFFLLLGFIAKVRGFIRGCNLAHVSVCFGAD
jgi:Mitochondrial ATP synthase B chain precursor (ATP-synt_B)